MQETLHLSSAAAAAVAVVTAPLPLHNPNSPSIHRPRHLHFPPHSPAVSLSTPLKSQQNQVTPPVSQPTSEDSQIQENILYLDSLGVDSFYCLHSHPPLISTPVAQIKSTVDFLLSLGITIQDLRRIFPMCPELLTSSTVIPATTFLLREARVKATDLRHVIHRRPRLLICSIERQLRPTLYFLQGTVGIEDVSKCTSLLSCSVESKFVPRIEYLQKLGFSYRNTIVMFRRFPSLFCYSIKDNLKPKFDYFVVEMGRELKELVAFPQYFSFSLENRIKPRHRICVEKGVCLALPTMLKLSEPRIRERLEVCCSSSAPEILLHVAESKFEKYRFSVEGLRIMELFKDLFKQWSNMDESDLSLETVSGGITNLLLKVSMREKDGSVVSTTVRLYGSITEYVIDRERELQAIPNLSAAGFGAKLLRIFGNGMVQSFLDACTLTPSDMRKPKLIAEIGK